MSKQSMPHRSCLSVILFCVSELFKAHPACPRGGPPALMVVVLAHQLPRLTLFLTGRSVFCLCTCPRPFPSPFLAAQLGLVSGSRGLVSSELLRLESKVLPGPERGCAGGPVFGLWSSCLGATTGLEQGPDSALSPADLENHQHACALVRGRAGLLCLPGAHLQDS